MRKAQLRALIAEKEAAISAMLKRIETEKRSLSKEEQDTVVVLEAEIEAAESELRTIENQEKRAARGGETTPPAAGNAGTPAAGSDERGAGPGKGQVTGDGTGKPPSVEVVQDKLVFRSFGDHVQAIAHASMPARLVDPAKQERAINMLREVEKRHQKAISDSLIGATPEHRAFVTGLQEKIGEDGAFVMQQDIAAGLFQRAYNLSSIQPLCRTAEISGNKDGIKIPAVKDDDRRTGHRLGGISMSWIDEGESGTTSQAKFRLETVNTRKLMGEWQATSEIIEDLAFLNSFVQDGFVEETQWMVDEAIMTGAGAKDPKGIKGANCTITVSKQTQGAGTFIYENTRDMIKQVLPSSFVKGSWIMHTDVWAQLPEMQIPTGNTAVLIYSPPNGMEKAPYGTLWGRPVLVSEHAEAAGTVGDVTFADLSQYLLLTKGGVRVDSSMHVLFDYDQWKFRIIMRVGGQPMWDVAVTPAKGSNKLSPFVNLEAR